MRVVVERGRSAKKSVLNKRANGGWVAVNPWQVLKIHISAHDVFVEHGVVSGAEQQGVRTQVKVSHEFIDSLA
jgi:hypothetical protein